MTLGVTSAAATPPIEFEGVMSRPSELRLAISDRASGATHWVRVGETIRGYTVRSYDATSETMAVVKDGVETRIPLKGVRIVGAGADSDELALRGASKAIYDNLHQLAVAAAQFFRETGKASATLADFVGPGKYIEVLRAASGEDYGSVRIERGSSLLSITTPGGETTTFDAQGGSLTEARFHLTREGDSLERLAAAAGNSVQRLLELNELAEPEGVRAGRVLRTN